MRQGRNRGGSEAGSRHPKISPMPPLENVAASRVGGCPVTRIRIPFHLIHILAFVLCLLHLIIISLPCHFFSAILTMATRLSFGVIVPRSSCRAFLRQSRPRPVNAQSKAFPHGLRYLQIAAETTRPLTEKAPLAPQPSRGVSKVYASADEAVADLKSGSTILSAGFGLCGTAGRAPYFNRSDTCGASPISNISVFKRL